MTIFIIILVLVVLLFSLLLDFLANFWWLIVLGIIGIIIFTINQSKRRKEITERFNREQEEKRKIVEEEDNLIEVNFLKNIQTIAEKINTSYQTTSTDENNLTFVIYTLQCREKHYYVGAIQANLFEKQMIRHYNGDSVEWTQKYRPVDFLSAIVIENINKDQAEEFVEMQARKVMAMFGGYKVRCDSYGNEEWDFFNSWLKENRYTFNYGVIEPTSNLQVAAGSEVYADYWNKLNEDLLYWQNTTDVKLGMIRKL